MSFLSNPATRQGIIPLIGLFGKSNTGKTYSALHLMRGLVGPDGRIEVVDTENRRASINTGRVPGGFNVIDFDAPFSPERYSEALDYAISLNPAGIIFDSTSHEWNGSGGYLEQKEAWVEERCGNDWKKRDKLALAAAAKCKPAHNRFVQKLLRAPVPIILCFRGKDKVQMGKDDSGKTTIIQPEHSSPIQDSGLIYEMLIAGETLNVTDEAGGEGRFRITKYTHPDLLHCLPANGEQIGIRHGEMIAAWCANPGAQKGEDKPKTPTQELRLIMHQAGQDVRAFEQWAITNGILADTETLKGMHADRIIEVLSATKKEIESIMEFQRTDKMD